MIIAVFVNVALLACLFATARGHSVNTQINVTKGVGKIDERIDRVPSSTDATSAISTHLVSENEGSSLDEIDQVIQEYAFKQKERENIAYKKEEAKTKKSAKITLQESAVPFSLAGTEPSVVSSDIHEDAKASLREVTVKQGDALHKIAKSYGTTVEDLMEVNGLKNSNLKIGQVLKIPKASLQKARSLKTEKVDASEYYIVKSGDNPWTIAKKFNLEFDELLEMNELNDEKARNLKIGQKLRIR